MRRNTRVADARDRPEVLRTPQRVGDRLARRRPARGRAPSRSRSRRPATTSERRPASRATHPRPDADAEQRDADAPRERMRPGRQSVGPRNGGVWIFMRTRSASSASPQPRRDDDQRRPRRRARRPCGRVRARGTEVSARVGRALGFDLRATRLGHDGGHRARVPTPAHRLTRHPSCFAVRKRDTAVSRRRRRLRSSPMIDVVLPALDEAGAIPGVLASLPAAIPPIVVDNGSTDATAAVARDAGRDRRGPEPRPGLRRGLFRRAARGHDRRRLLHGLRRLPRRARPRARRRAGAGGEADLVLGARRATRGAWPVHARIANRVLAVELRRRLGHRAHGTSARCARRGGPSSLALGIEDRRFGWPLEMVVHGRSRGLAHRGGRRALRTARSAARRSRGRCAAPPARSATWRRCCGDRRHPPRDREGAASRPGQDPALPALHPRAGGDHRRGRARRHAPDRGRDARACDRPRARRPARLLAAGRSARGARRAPVRSADRLAAAFRGATGPTVLVGMDTPQITRVRRAECGRCTRWHRVSTPRSARPPTAVGGRIGLRDPHRSRRSPASR